MVKIRSIEEIGAKWERVTPDRQPYYEAGVKAPKKDWETEAKAAAPTWEAGVRGAIANKMFEKGVAAAKTAKWQDKTVKKGVPRYPEGIRVAGPDYKAGFGPYRDELERLVLPARGAAGDPKNIDRVRAIATALHAKRVGAPPA